MTPATHRPHHGGYPSPEHSPAKAGVQRLPYFDPASDLRQGVTLDQHDILDMLDLLPSSHALLEVLNERRIQIHDFGHDAEADAMLPLHELPRKAEQYLTIALDCIRGTMGQRDLPRAYRKLIQATALLLAGADRIDGAGKGGTGA